MAEIFPWGDRLQIQSSWFFLYPPGGYMGWHTNWQNPGWRLYINDVEEPGKLFFRYQDPDTKKIVTSWDQPLNFRLFRVSAKRPFWHTVFSQTYRYSLGFKIVEPENFFDRVKKRLGGLLAPARSRAASAD